MANNRSLADDLTAIEYSYNMVNALLLERKEHIRARGLPSSDWSDALALTFAEDVRPRERNDLRPWEMMAEPVFDRFAELH